MNEKKKEDKKEEEKQEKEDLATQVYNRYMANRDDE